MAEPVRIERDGDVAVVVLENPPLNLFDEEVFAGWAHAVGELVALTDPGHADRARAVLVEARGKVVSGGVDVSLFQAIADDPEAVQRAGTLWARLLRVAQTLEDLPVPTVFAAHGLTLTASFEIALACDILLAAEQRVVRAGGDRGRADAVDGRPAAARRAGGPGAGPGAGLHGRALPGRGAGAVERGEPGAARRGLRRGRPRVRAPGGGGADRRARGDQAAGRDRGARRRARRRRRRARRLGRVVRHHRPARGGGVLPERRARARRSTVGAEPAALPPRRRVPALRLARRRGPHQARAVRRALPRDLRRRARPVRGDRRRAVRAAQQALRHRRARVRRRPRARCPPRSRPRSTPSPRPG